MNNFMIDLETASKRPDAVILSIACVKFDPRAPIDTNVPDEYVFSFNVKPEQPGRHLDADTVAWWLTSAPDHARRVAWSGSVSLKYVLQRLVDFLGPKPIVWAQGAAFDIPILEDAFAQADVRVPWAYYDVRDTRTVYDLAGDDRRLQDVDHEAVLDAIKQCFRVQENVQRLLDPSLSISVGIVEAWKLDVQQ